MEEQGAMTAWLDLCETMRRVGAAEFVERVGPRLADLCFRLSLPTIRRPLAVYSPVKALAWRKLLGDDWHRIVQPDVDMMLPRDRFLRWQTTPVVRDAVRTNIVWWNTLLSTSTHIPLNIALANKPGSASPGGTSAVTWHRVLQAAYEFAEPETFEAFLTQAERLHPNPDAAAIFYLIW